MGGGSGTSPRSQLASTRIKDSNPDPSDSRAGPFNRRTPLPFIHISTQEIFTYRLIGSLCALMLPRWSPCMSVCFSQTATLLKNILIVLCNNLSSGDGDLQTANCLGGGRELGPFRYLFSRSGSSYMPPRLLQGHVGERPLRPIMGDDLGPWVPRGLAAGLFRSPPPTPEPAGRPATVCQD